MSTSGTCNGGGFFPSPQFGELRQISYQYVSAEFGGGNFILAYLCCYVYVPRYRHTGNRRHYTLINVVRNVSLAPMWGFCGYRWQKCRTWKLFSFFCLFVCFVCVCLCLCFFCFLIYLFVCFVLYQVGFFCLMCLFSCRVMRISFKQTP